MTARLLVFAGLVAMLSTGCAVRTGAYVGPVGPVGYYGEPVGYYGSAGGYYGDGYLAPYAVPAWRERVVVAPRRYYAPRAYVRVAPRYYRPAGHVAFRGGHRGRW